MTPIPLLVATNLRCVLGKTEILRGLNLHLNEGEILGIVGPNGAGKSTLLRCLNGLLPVQGSVELRGRPLASYSPKELARESALMPQNTSVGFPFPAEEVVMMGRYAHQGRFHPESAEDRRVVAEVMEFTDTSRLARQSIDDLSGGERQRVLFAKTLAQTTRILLLDEPSASLDITYQDQIFSDAQSLAKNGKAIVAAVHDLRLAARYCTRVVLLSRGTMVAEGSAETVLTPAHLEAAYGKPVRVYRNPMTGGLDFHLTGKAHEGQRRIHVIGGGGTASEVFRLLGNGGYKVTTGVLNSGDTDLQMAAFYGIPAVTDPAFSAISDRAFAENKRLVDEAAITIVSGFPIGNLNLRNLEAALHARRLILLEDDDPAARDFTGGSGLELYQRLSEGATVLKTIDLAVWLQELQEPD